MQNDQRAWEGRLARHPDIATHRLPDDVLNDNFSDMYPMFDRNEARVAAERCLFCYDAPCVTACPTSIDIPLFIRQISTANPVGAAKTIFDSNILGGMCARVCPTENLCEGACVKETSESRAVEIGRLQRYATDTALAAGKQFYKAGPKTGAKVAIVGGGPAGLACAHKLATFGHDVTIYDAQDKLGGLNEFGIAAYKATDFAAREVQYVLDIGNITVKTCQCLGRDMTLTSLRESHDAVFLGMGLGDTNHLGVGDDKVEGLIDAVDFIASLRQAKDKAALPVGRNIVVIGGGMTAIDIATQTKRLGAESVTIAYRRGKASMNASLHEQELALTNGVTIRHWLMPKRIHSAGGHIHSVELEYTKDDNGKLVGTGESVTLPCDQLFTAIGQVFVPSDVDGAALEMEKGRIKVDAERRASLAGVWAGGDCIAGGLDLTVAAVEDGKQAGISIDRALRARMKVAAE
jgi:dihydropyrimidine dehydrogenase (NAD+) subunit PreT